MRMQDLNDQLIAWREQQAAATVDKALRKERGNPNARVVVGALVSIFPSCLCVCMCVRRRFVHRFPVIFLQVGTWHLSDFLAS